MNQTLEDIQDKVSDSKAKVLTVEELLELAEKGDVSSSDVDVVTCATKGIMSGTYCVLSFQVSEPKVFRKAKRVWLNGVEGMVGPCPNEFLGVLDILIMGTTHSKNDPDHYGGGHLFREIVEGNEIQVEVETDDGRTIEAKITINDMNMAKMFGTRHAFKNYLCFVNPDPEPLKTIFSVDPFDPNNAFATFCGCGAMNPLQNDPARRVIKAGSKVLINGAEGLVLGNGTRSSDVKPNLSTCADLKDMDPSLMGGFITSAGPEVICSVAAAIPVLNDDVFNDLIKKENDVPMTIVDVKGRSPLGKVSYSDVWFDNYYVSFEPSLCIRCDECAVKAGCPTRCFDPDSGKDETKCFQCGHCILICPGTAFNCDLGGIELEGSKIPVRLRHSDRFSAVKQARKLKELIKTGKFRLSLSDQLLPF